jgi:hypothetical protein
MSIASNQYAAKVFSEHPTAIWPLDDDACFISLLNQSESNINNWNKTNCSTTSSPTLPDTPSPFNGKSNYYGIIGDHSILSTSGGTIEVRSDPIFSFNSLNEELKNFSINLYLYQDSVYVSSYEFGFRYFDTFIGSYKEVLVDVPSSPISEWIQFSDTFNVPEFDSDTCEIIIRANVIGGGTSNEYNFIVHGLSSGQWSEPFSSKTIGSVPSLLPSSVGMTGYYGISSDQYGPLSDNAYYVIEDGALLTKTDGVPMVFGSSSSARVSHSSIGSPSFVLPSKGFLSESGKYRTQTLEFWIRIKPNTKLDRRIFGPLNSNDGVYVSEGFITLSVGNNFQTHSIHEWYRPMLIHILYNETNCQMYINGEQVIEIDINREELLFQTDWLAFYSYEDIDTFEIDCISIIPYSLPLQVARRRFVWGQGVESQQIIDDSFKGKSTAISFPNAEYSSNIVYPDKERWDSGYYNNLLTTPNSLSVPEYSLPEIYLSNRNQDFWYQENKKVNEIEYPSGNHPKFITFRPGLNSSQTEWVRNTTDWNEKSYLQFSTANIASSPISAMFAIFEAEDNIATDRPLMHIVNSISGKRFEINLNEYNVSYSYDDQELYSIDTTGQEHIVVGFHIPTLSEYFGFDISNFFSSYEALAIYVAGSPDTISTTFETFEGKIYKVSFSDDSNYSQISDHFLNNGIANYDDDSLFLGHYATYTVSPFVKYGKFFLDISISASWEEYYPLSMFADYAVDNQGDSFYGIDYLQFNVGYPSYIEKIQTSSIGPEWENYSEFEQSFAYPIQKSYEILDNELITGYANYNDLNNNVITEYLIDTSKSSMDIFATFQLISEGADEPIANFPYTKELSFDKVVDAQKENTVLDPYRAYKTKFSVIDGTIIYPPKNIKFEDVALNINFSINKDAIISHPLSVRDMKISSKTLNSNSPNPIGTKFGNKIYPYTKRGIYFDYKSKNPILLYERNDPYLYLTEKTGVKLLTYNEINNEKLISIPINENSQNNFSVAAIQLFLKYDIEEAIDVPFSMFEIQYKDSIIEFVADLDTSAKRVVVRARDKFTKNQYSNATFYQNGAQTKNIYLEKNYWYSVGVVFTEPLDFSSFVGAVNIFGGTNFDNISYYSPDGLNQVASIIPRSWQDILTQDNVNNLNWGYWYNENGSSPIKQWKDLYVFAEAQRFSLDVSDIYSSYLGTNGNVVDDNSGITIQNDDFYIYSDLIWSSTVGKPA